MPDLSSTSYDAFTHRVMRRVYMVYVMRRVGTPVIVESALLSVCALMGSFMVSFRHILTNAERIPTAPAMLPLIRFFWAAFLNTDSVVKTICVAMSVTTILFCYSTVYPLVKSIIRQSGRILGQIFVFFQTVRDARTVA